MDLPELKKCIVNKKIENFYMFVGEEFGIMEKYIESISKVLNKPIKRLDSINDLINITKTGNLLKQDFLYVIRDDKNLIKSEAAWKKLKTLKKSLILIYSKLDKRGKFYKHFKNDIIEFEKLKTEQLIRYVQKELGLKKEYSEDLVSMTGNSYNRLLLEIDKIKNLSDATQCKHEYSYLTLKGEDLIYEEPKDVIFDFVDAVVTNNKKQAFILYNQLKKLNVANLQALTLLYNNFRNILMVQGSAKPTQEKTGLTGWIIQKTKEKCGFFNIPKLIDILHSIQFIESGIKKGRVDSNIALEYCLLKVFKED